MTEEVSHWPMSTLKEDEVKNIETILVTVEVLHWPMSLLKEEALENICPISMTKEVFHWPMSLLNEKAELNICHSCDRRSVPLTDVSVERSSGEKKSLPYL